MVTATAWTTSTTGTTDPGRRFARGETAVLRYITRDGRPGMSWPCTVVTDEGNRVALFIPRGTVYMRWGAGSAAARSLEPGEWRRDTLRLMFAGQPYSVWFSWEQDEGGRRFAFAYINMEEPFRRTAIGFDTNDHMLDVVVSPEGSWRWKDEDVLAARVAEGIYSPAFADEVRAHALEAIGLLEGGRPPFSEGWERWQPDPAWALPALPAGWDTVPPVPWERRTWAYLDARR